MTRLLCRNCEYDLSGIDRAGVCPECAADIAGSIRAAEEAARRPRSHRLALCSQSLSIGAGAIGVLLTLRLLDTDPLGFLVAVAVIAVMFGPFAGLWLISFLQRTRVAASIALLIANGLLVALAGFAYYGAVIAPRGSTSVLGLLAIPFLGYPFVAVIALVTLVGLRRFR